MTEWIPAGSIRLSKSGKGLVIEVSGRRYVASAKGVGDVLTKKREVCRISEGRD